MSISIYDASVPAFTKHLEALDAMIDKAQAHAEAKKQHKRLSDDLEKGRSELVEAESRFADCQAALVSTSDHLQDLGQCTNPRALLLREAKSVFEPPPCGIERMTVEVEREIGSNFAFAQTAIPCGVEGVVTS